MNKCIFTIVAKNYIGLALILEKSIKRHYSDFQFYIIVADEVDQCDSDFVLPENCLIGRDFLNFSDQVWEEMSFKYNLTEFCTSIKPACFLQFFLKYEKVVYLDPDILFFHSAEVIFNLLDTHKAVVTPHILYPCNQNATDTAERNWLQCGIFNFGFLALNASDSVMKVVEWWGQRLLNFCFIDSYDATYTDQKWGDFFPSFFEFNELLVWRNTGANLAPWNFFERQIVLRDGVPFVRFRNRSNVSSEMNRLLFVHYSAYEYTGLLKGLFIQKSISLPHYQDIDYALEEYARVLIEDNDTFNRFITQKYTYNYFNNGEYIDDAYRRLYRASQELTKVYRSPFSTMPDTFYELLKRSKLLLGRNQVIGRLTVKDIDKLDEKVALINKASRIFFKIIGVKKYLLLIKYMRRFGRVENQGHLFEFKD